MNALNGCIGCRKTRLFCALEKMPGSLEAPEGIFLSAQKRIQEDEKPYLSYGSVIYGTAAPVPFQHPVLTQTL
jgi:hypothetical protein